MNFKGLMAMTAAVALAATPAIAAGNSAARASALTPAMETVDGSPQADAGNWVLIGLAVAAVGLGIWAAVDNGTDAPNAPVSP